MERKRKNNRNLLGNQTIRRNTSGAATKAIPRLSTVLKVFLKTQVSTISKGLGTSLEKLKLRILFICVAYIR